MSLNDLDEHLPVMPMIVGLQSQSHPLIIAVPHSGRLYPAEFLSQSRLSLARLRTMEDFEVDHIFASAPLFGAAVITAPYARVWLDVNRRPTEIDPRLVAQKLLPEDYEITTMVKNGIGLIPRLVAGSEPIYRQKLSRVEFAERITLAYEPYHRGVQLLIESTMQKFGHCRIIDAHSMPSQTHHGAELADIVLGDCFGQSCSAEFLQTVESALTERGLSVVMNEPYAGGFTTQQYSRREDGVEVLQLEINRRLYMDESRLERLPEFERILSDINFMLGRLEGLSNC